MARHSGGTDSWCIEASVDHQSGDIISGNAVDDVVTDGENAIQIALAAADGAKCQRSVSSGPVQFLVDGG